MILGSQSSELRGPGRQSSAASIGRRTSEATAPALVIRSGLIVGRRHLEHVLRIYIQHYNRERPHRGLALQPPEPLQVKQPQSGDVRRHDRLGGLLHEYYRAAA